MRPRGILKGLCSPQETKTGAVACEIYWSEANPLFVLKGNIGAINALRFSSDEKFMATAKSIYYVHIYDVERGFEFEQEIDFFGKTSGISFSPETKKFFIGVSPCSTHDTSFPTYDLEGDDLVDEDDDDTVYCF
jgi:WD40 repeat protein